MSFRISEHGAERAGAVSEEEIFELAASLGLDPKRLTLYEPYSETGLGGRVYRMKYTVGDGYFTVNFIISWGDPEDIAIEFHVNDGLRQIREMAGKTALHDAHY